MHPDILKKHFPWPKSVESKALANAINSHVTGNSQSMLTLDVMHAAVVARVDHCASKLLRHQLADFFHAIRDTNNTYVDILFKTFN